MATNDYVFVDKFIVPCDKETAYEYIKNIEDYPRWWGKVYKQILVLQQAMTDSPDGRYQVQIRGFLPYTLTIQNETTMVQRPNRIEFVAFGDLEGKGTWLFDEVQGGTQITFDWRVAANKLVIRLFSFLLKPLFRANHVYCIRKAEEGMRKDLEKRGRTTLLVQKQSIQ